MHVAVERARRVGWIRSAGVWTDTGISTKGVSLMMMAQFVELS